MRLFPFFFLLLTPLYAATNYEQDVRPIFARRCFTCHSAAEMRGSLNLETYQGVLKGGGSGDVVKPGRPTSSVLFQAISHEGNGVPLMPLGNPKIPDSEISTIRDWISLGLLENAASQPKGTPTASLEFKPTALNKPTGPPAMPQSLPPLTLPPPARPHPITALAASPWAPLLAVAGHERIYLYNLATRARLGELPFPEGIPYVLRFTRDGSKLLAAGGRGVQSGKAVLYDVRTGKRLATIGQEPDIILAADITADAKLIAIGGPGKVVKVFSVADAKQLYELKKHTDWITALEFSPDGKRLATGDRAGGIHLWEAPTGGIIVSLSEHKDSITTLSWRGDGLLLASGSEDGSIIQWNSQDGFSVATSQNAHAPKPAKGTYGKPPGGVLSVDFLPDGRLVSVGRDRMVKIWGTDGKQKSASAVAEGLLTKVTASPDSKFVIAGDYEGRLLAWDGAKDGTKLAPFLPLVTPDRPQGHPEYNYDESKVAPYTLPDPLTLASGKPVRDAATWKNQRRPELLRLFEENVYGRTPRQRLAPTVARLLPDGPAFNGKATRRQIRISFADKKIDLLIYIPTAAKRPVPAFLGPNFSGNQTVANDPGIHLGEVWTRDKSATATEQSRGTGAGQWQVEKIIDRGYALATFYYGDVEPDFDGGIKYGIRSLFYRPGQTAPAADEWGAIGAWAWGLSRALDYLDDDRDIDAHSVAVMGHSRLGKTALWAAAQDQRFAIAISNCSGAGGASLFRRNFGETVEHLNTAFPHWFAANFHQYSAHPDRVPVDEHELLALIAPRPLYIATADQDLGADPHGEFLSANAAAPVYELLGKQGLGTAVMPAIHQPIMHTIAFHERAGKHDVTAYDWDQYLTFADMQFALRSKKKGGSEDPPTPFF